MKNTTINRDKYYAEINRLTDQVIKCAVYLPKTKDHNGRREMASLLLDITEQLAEQLKIENAVKAARADKAVQS